MTSSQQNNKNKKVNLSFSDISETSTNDSNDTPNEDVNDFFIDDPTTSKETSNNETTPNTMSGNRRSKKSLIRMAGYLPTAKQPEIVRRLILDDCMRKHGLEIYNELMNIKRFNHHNICGTQEKTVAEDFEYVKSCFVFTKRA
jgi:hypothetical protein